MPRGSRIGRLIAAIASRTCAFCTSADDLTPCCWPDVRFVRSNYGSLVAGDRVRRAQESKALRIRKAARVVETRPIQAGHYIEVILDIRGRQKKIWVLKVSPVLVERPAPCGTLCCEKHRAERADEHAICRSHWNAWEQIA